MDEEKINHVLNIDIPNWQRDWDNNFTSILISLIAKADRALRLFANQALRPALRHKFSAETLIHFRCSNCKQWWAIGDADTSLEYHCPRCGVKAGCEKAKSEEFK